MILGQRLKDGVEPKVCGRVGELQHQPSGGHLLHPGPDVGNDLAGEVKTEVSGSQGAQAPAAAVSPDALRASPGPSLHYEVTSQVSTFHTSVARELSPVTF